MVIGIGVDLLDCRRIYLTIERFGARFLNKIYLTSEQEYINGRFKDNKKPELFMRQRALGYAKLYAAKEAVLKAFGTGVAAGLSWQHIEIRHEASGRPIVQVHSKAHQYWRQIGGQQISISLSDEWPYVQAFAVIS